MLFSGNGVRAIGVIAALEADLGRPVLTANQVAFWYALGRAGVRAPVNGYGRVFRTRCRHFSASARDEIEDYTDVTM